MISGATGSDRNITVGTGWWPVFTTTERPTGLLVAHVDVRATLERDREEQTR